MKTEIEAKWLNVNHDSLRKRLEHFKATCTQKERLMKRAIFDYPDKSLAAKHGWVRLRDEGDKVTLSYKQLNDRTLHGTKEITLSVNAYTEAENFLQALGLVKKSYQETKRESWILNDTEIELDSWPWIEPVVEIEASSEKALKDTAHKLGLTMDSAVYGSIENAYTDTYDIAESDVLSWDYVVFSDVPDWLEAKRKD